MPSSPRDKPRPLLTVDMILTRPGDPRHVVLVRRRNPPEGWALPGGFVELGETVEQAAVREILEETGLVVTNARQFHVYSDPARDPRGHTISVVFAGEAEGDPVGGDDAAEARWFAAGELPRSIAFDHAQILKDFFAYRY